MSAATVPRARNRVGWRDLGWVTWRQHRTMLVSTGALALALAAAMALLTIAVATRGSTQISVLMFETVEGPAALLATCVLGYSGLIAVFWAAPLLSREYEQRTHLFAWSQDISAARWLASKTIVLVAAAIALALALGITAQIMVAQLDATTATASTPPMSGVLAFRMPYFAAAVLPQVGYTLFGFALGLALSALCRRTILAMGLTLGTLLVTRFLIATLARPYYQPPERVTTPLGREGFSHLPDNALSVETGLLDQAGNPIDYRDYPPACQTNVSGRDDYYSCLRQHGIVSYYRDYQPADRLGTFHLVEFGLYTALALALFLVTWRLTRRATRL